MMKEQPLRLQKFLARAGAASRRQAEVCIADGRVTVNGEVANQPGIHVLPGQDTVTLDGRTLSLQSRSFRTIILHKPRGYICSTSAAQGKTVYALLDDIEERLVPVGRLDKNSEGVLLMSNDGELVNRLTHPRYEQEKTYRVTVSGSVTAMALRKLSSAMLIDGYRTRPARVRLLATNTPSPHALLEFRLMEGRNRQIRKMCEEVDLTVRRLVRTRVKSVTLKGLATGRWRDLTPAELAALKT